MTERHETMQHFHELRALYGALHARMLESRRYYAREFESEVMSPGARARGFKPVIPGTARRAIDEAVDHLLYVPKIHVPVRPTESRLVTEQQIAEKKRKASLAWWRQVTQRFNPLGDGRKWLFLDGMIAVKHTLRWDMVPDKDDKDYARKLKNLGKNEFMWKEEILNNEWVFIDPIDHRNPQYAFIHYSMMVEEAKRQYGGPVGVIGGEWRNGPRYSKVNYTEYWSAPEWKDDGTWEPGRYEIFIDDERVHNDINPYPYIPIAVEDSGYGLVHSGIEMEDKFVGLIDHSLSIFVAQARQWTAMEAVAELTAFNPIITHNMGDEAVKKVIVGPGEIISLDGNPQTDPEAESMEISKWPDIPNTVQQMLGLTDREVNSVLKSDTLGGGVQRGVDTASEADQNIRNASAKLQGPVAALERLAAKLTRWYLMDIELVLEAPVTLYGSGADDPADITLTPKDISGYYDCFVELSTTDEDALSLTKARFWGELYRVLPFLSAWTAMERGGISDDPLAEMLRRSGEDVFLSPEFAQIRVATGAKSFGEFSTYIAQLAAEKGTGGGARIPGANSAEGLVTQTGDAAPISIAQEGVADPDMMALTQAASSLRASRTIGRAPGQ